MSSELDSRLLGLSSHRGLRELECHEERQQEPAPVCGTSLPLLLVVSSFLSCIVEMFCFDLRLPWQGHSKLVPPQDLDWWHVLC